MHRIHNRFFPIASAALCFGLFVSASAQKNPKDHFEYPALAKIQIPPVREAVLPNGMKLFLIEDRDYPTIDLRAMIHTGSVYDPADKIGLSDITGTVLRTGGSKSLPGDEMDKLLETLGASVETGIDGTSGYVSVSLLKEDIDKGLEVLSGILTDPAFPQEKIDLAKIEQKSGISRRNDNVRAIASREFSKLIFGKDNPYVRQTEYTTIDAITREDLVAFHQKYFHPNNVIMAAWGDFNAKDMEKKIAKAFAGWKKAKLDIPPVPKVNYQYDHTVNYINKPDVNQTNILLGHVGTLQSNPDYPALEIMNQILSYERMFKKIRTEQGLAYSVWGYYGADFDHEGTFSSGCQTKSETTLKAIRLMLAEIKNIQETEVTDEELQRAKDNYLNGFVFNFDSKSKIVERLMTYSYFDYPRNFMDMEKQAVEKVTKADILRVAKQYLHPDQVRILVVGKQENFDEPLNVLGPVNVIDIAIPEPKAEPAQATAESKAQGMALLRSALQAMGGVDALKNLKNVQASCQITQTTPMGEMKITGDITMAFQSGFRMLMNTSYGQMTMIVTDTSAWMTVPGQGTMPLPEQQARSARRGLIRDPANLARSLDRIQAQYVGKKKLEGKEMEDILITWQDGDSFHLLIDPQTNLPSGMIYQDTGMQGPEEKTDIISGYQPFGPLMLSTKTVVMNGETQESETTISSMKTNVPDDPTWFAKP